MSNHSLIASNSPLNNFQYICFQCFCSSDHGGVCMLWGYDILLSLDIFLYVVGDLLALSVWSHHGIFLLHSLKHLTLGNLLLSSGLALLLEDVIAPLGLEGVSALLLCFLVVLPVHEVVALVVISLSQLLFLLLRTIHLDSTVFVDLLKEDS